MQHILLIGNPNVGKSTLIVAKRQDGQHLRGDGPLRHKVSFQGLDRVVDLGGLFALDAERQSKSVRDGLYQPWHGGVLRGLFRPIIATLGEGSFGALQPL